MTESKIITKPEKKKKLRGFPATLAGRVEPVNDIEEFKEFAKDLSIKLLLNPIDGKHAALVSVENGIANVTVVLNDDKEALKKRNLKWNGKMSTDLRTFLEFAAGNLSLLQLGIKILKGKIKVRGLLYFVLLEKIYSLIEKKTKGEELNPDVKIKKSRTLFAARLFVFSGFLHILLAVLTFNINEIFYGAVIFAFFFIWLGSMVTKLIKANVTGERTVLISCTTISFLNIMTYFTYIYLNHAGEQSYLNIIMWITIGFDVFNFIIFYDTKIKLDRMDAVEKWSYFSIVIIRGLGIGLLFNLIAWVIPPNVNLVMIVYISIFGIINTIYGNKLYSKKDDVKVQVGAILTEFLGLIFSILIFAMYIPDPKTMGCVLIYCIVLPIRIYYLKKKF